MASCATFAKSIARFRFAAALLALSLAPHGADADVMTVEVSGQALATGAASDAHLERRALQEALYQAALQGGAQVNGYTAISQSLLSSDVLVVRPDSKILDYTVLSSRSSDKKAVVKIRAVVGQLDEPAVCGRRAQLDVAVHRPSLRLSHHVPPWAPHIGPDVFDALHAKLKNTSGVTSRSPVNTPVVSNVNPAFDYATLTQGAAPTTGATGVAGQHTLKLKTTITVGSTDLTNTDVVLPIKITVALENNPFDAGTLHATHTEELPLKSRGVLGTVLRTRGDAQRNTIETIAHITTQMVTKLIEQRACQDLVGKLRFVDNQLTLPFGRRDGLSTHHLAYTQGRDTAYEILEVVSLSAHEAVLRPLDSATQASKLDETTVQFMELKQ